MESQKAYDKQKNTMKYTLHNFHSLFVSFYNILFFQSHFRFISLYDFWIKINLTHALSIKWSLYKNMF